MPNNGRKQIAKNTILLYLRTIVSLVVGLFASRILLNQLGADDYGLYNLIGSVVMIFASLRVILATSTQRFLNYETKENNIQRKAIIFITSEKIHWGICAVFFIIAEIGGLYLINNKIDILPNMYFIAHILLQLSIISAIITITTIPYDAVIISNENFGIYAIFSIIESLLKLLSALLLIFIDKEKVIYYGLFILLSSLIIRIVNIIYCKRHYQECQLNVLVNKNVAKELCKFAGWNFLGNTAYTFCNEGINVVINIFGGVIANAARAISYQIYNALSEICAKVISGASPQAIRIYANKQYQEFNAIIGLSTRIIGLLYLVVALPISSVTAQVLLFWLGEIPLHTISFVKVILIYGFLRAIHFPLDLCFKASGKMAAYQIAETLCLLPAIPIAYIFLYSGFPLYFAFLALILCNIINTVAILYLAAKKTSFDCKTYISKALVPIVILSSIGIGFVLGVSYIDSVIVRVAIIEIGIIIMFFLCCLSQDERQKLGIIIARHKIRL